MASSRPVVLVTGSSAGGLGEAVCKEFRAKDYRVFATARKLESIESLKAEGCDLLVLDVTKLDTITAAAQELSVKTGGRLDVIINTAGTVDTAPAISQDPAGLRAAFDTNVIGPTLIVQAFVPLMIRSSNGKAGVVVNISSVQGIIGLPWMSSYAASKAAMRSLSSTWRMELKGFGISVIDVVGGGIKTNMTGKLAPQPESSETGFYWNWKDIMAQSQKSFEGVAPVSPDLVARDIVAAATKKSPPSTIYVGAGASPFKYLQYLPLSWIESMIGSRFGTSLVSYRP